MDISVQDLKNRINSNETLNILDVREVSEYNQANIGAINIPLGTLPDKLDLLSKYKDSELIVHCKSGRRSATAQKYLQENGFSNVRNVIGGIDAFLTL